MNSIRATANTVLLASAIFGAAAVLAQAPARPPIYGTAINVDGAKRIAAASTAEARRSGLSMAVAVVDTAGQLIYFERMDDTQIGSVQVAVDKAKSAALFRRPTKVFNDLLAAGNTSVLAISGAVPLDGGLPIVYDGKVVGAIGVSGGAPAQDAAVAKAGADLPK